MQYKGENLCDFCFSPIGSDGVCRYCGLNHNTYKIDAGLLVPGTNLNGKYIIGRLLGRGGFGATYLAYSSALNKRVAIKEYLPIGIVYRGKNESNITIVSEDKKQVFDKGASRFFEEAKTISRFNKNPNVVSVYEFFYANDTVYYSMEYLEGTDLKKFIDYKGGKLSVEESMTIIKNICNALIIVHSTQTLHRDISPDNIYICKNGDVKLIDFGAAKQVLSDEQHSYSVVVKQGFAPAEQYSKKGRQGVWTDIYALGATLYYMLMGTVPADAIDRTENPELDFDSRLPHARELLAIINKCMEPRISDRYQSVVELMGDITSIDVAPVKLENNLFVQAEATSGGGTAVSGQDVSDSEETKDIASDKIDNEKDEINHTEFKKTTEEPSESENKTVKITPDARNDRKFSPVSFLKNKAVLYSLIGGLCVAVLAVSFGIYMDRKNEVVDVSGGGVVIEEVCATCQSTEHTTAEHIVEKCAICESTEHTTDKHPKCAICESTEHTTDKHPKCATCGSTEHTTDKHPKTQKKCATCGSTAHTTANHPKTQKKCATCGSTAHTTAKHPVEKCAKCGSTAHTTANHPVERCATCGSTAHTTANHPVAKCPVCGSTAHTAHPVEKCSICGSTSHTSGNHPTARCPVCGSADHTAHPAPDVTIDF